GRIVWLADYFEHSRAEGLYVFTIEPGFTAIPRFILGGDCRCDDAIYRTVAEGNLWRSRPAAKGSAVGGRAEGNPELFVWKFHPAEFFARGFDQPIAICEFAGTRGFVAFDLCSKGECGYAEGHSANCDAVHQAGRDDDRGGGRQGEDQRAACAVHDGKFASA